MKQVKSPRIPPVHPTVHGASEHELHLIGITIGTKIRLLRESMYLNMGDVQNDTCIQIGYQSLIENNKYSEVKDCDQKVQVLMDYYLTKANCQEVYTVIEEKWNYAVQEEASPAPQRVSLQDLKDVIGSAFEDSRMQQQKLADSVLTIAENSFKHMRQSLKYT